MRGRAEVEIRSGREVTLNKSQRHKESIKQEIRGEGTPEKTQEVSTWQE